MPICCAHSRETTTVVFASANLVCSSAMGILRKLNAPLVRPLPLLVRTCCPSTILGVVTGLVFRGIAVALRLCVVFFFIPLHLVNIFEPAKERFFERLLAAALKKPANRHFLMFPFLQKPQQKRGFAFAGL